MVENEESSLWRLRDAQIRRLGGAGIPHLEDYDMSVKGRMESRMTPGVCDLWLGGLKVHRKAYEKRRQTLAQKLSRESLWTGFGSSHFPPLGMTAA